MIQGCTPSHPSHTRDMYGDSVYYEYGYTYHTRTCTVLYMVAAPTVALHAYTTKTTTTTTTTRVERVKWLPRDVTRVAPRMKMVITAPPPRQDRNSIRNGSEEETRPIGSSVESAEALDQGSSSTSAISPSPLRLLPSTPPAPGLSTVALARIVQDPSTEACRSPSWPGGGEWRRGSGSARLHHRGRERAIVRSYRCRTGRALASVAAAAAAAAGTFFDHRSDPNRSRTRDLFSIGGVHPGGERER